jgi:hypothetical protein
VPDAALKRLAGLVAGEWREAAGKRPAEDVVVIAAPQLAQALSELV